MSERTILTANSGEVLTDGVVFGKTIYLSDDTDALAFYSITDTEYESMQEWTALYTQKENDFWDEFQNKGKRTDYSYAFANWTHVKIKPKYGIVADKMMYMFMGCSEITDMSDIVIKNTSATPNLMYVFANCAKMTHPPRFIFDAAIVKTYMSMYAACYSVDNISIYWGDGTADPVTQRNACQNMFFKCWNLKSIDFGKSETGSPLNLDLSYSKDLTLDSVLSLQNSLVSIPDGSHGTYEITLATQTFESLTEEVINGFTTKGWTLKSQEREEMVEEEEA